ncbi:MAG TPA: nicotinate-nucleotide adenylyltransferase [Candidatus Dormibacteraeota bacterium]|nr:nicotinate-nucleotide adenylyltransferase [Candidatus Dormibacteraeota bacterium]
MKLGVVGGTFDPIHLGHVAMAEAGAACAGLDRVLLVPANVPPHRGPATASSEDRLAMVRLAAAGHSRLEVSDVELRRAGPSYTADTLRALAAEHPDAELHLLLGWDAAREIRAWHRPDEVMRLARLVIVTRPGYPRPAEADLRAAGIDPDRVVLCDVPTPDVESTDVRRLAETGGSLAGLLDPAVEAYVRSRQLYGARSMKEVR